MISPRVKINFDSNLNNTSPEFLSIVPSSLSIHIAIFIPGGNGRDKNLVVCEVRGGMAKVVGEKLKHRRLFFSVGIKVPFPPPPEALYEKAGYKPIFNRHPSKLFSCIQQSITSS